MNTDNGSNSPASPKFGSFGPFWDAFRMSLDGPGCQRRRLCHAVTGPARPSHFRGSEMQETLKNSPKLRTARPIKGLARFRKVQNSRLAGCGKRGKPLACARGSEGRPRTLSNSPSRDRERAGWLFPQPAREVFDLKPTRGGGRRLSKTSRPDAEAQRTPSRTRV
jgi:hypothetical protein